jgi:hypothetical protein
MQALDGIITGMLKQTTYAGCRQHIDVLLLVKRRQSSLLVRFLSFFVIINFLILFTQQHSNVSHVHNMTHWFVKRPHVQIDVNDMINNNNDVVVHHRRSDDVMKWFVVYLLL